MANAGWWEIHGSAQLSCVLSFRYVCVRKSRRACAIGGLLNSRSPILATRAENRAATHPQVPTETHGTPQNGKIGKLRVGSGILRIRGSAFRFPPLCPSAAVSFISHFRVGRRALMPTRSEPPPPGTPRNGRNLEITRRVRNFRESSAAHSLFPLCHPSDVISFISHFRAGCWAELKAALYRGPFFAWACVCVWGGPILTSPGALAYRITDGAPNIEPFRGLAFLVNRKP